MTGMPLDETLIEIDLIASLVFSSIGTIVFPDKSFLISSISFCPFINVEPSTA